MAPFLFRCPNTGLHVQGWVADDGSEDTDETYETVSCGACLQVHLVSPRTCRSAPLDLGTVGTSHALWHGAGTNAEELTWSLYAVVR